MKESVFVTEVMHSLRAVGFWAYKIPDAPITKELLRITRFTMAKPCDIVACLEGRFVAIECKQLRKWKSFARRDMRPAQMEMLEAIEQHGGTSWVFVNIRVPKEPSRLIIFEWAEVFERFVNKKKCFTTKELQARHFIPLSKINGRAAYNIQAMKGAI